MSGPDDALLDTLRQWVAKAENDLTAAAYTLRMGRASPTDTVCFTPSSASRSI